MKSQESKAEYCLLEMFEAFPQKTYMEKKRELAAKLGIGVAQLDRLLRGNCDPSGTQLKIIAQFFECSVDSLYKSPTVLKPPQ